MVIITDQSPGGDGGGAVVSEMLGSNNAIHINSGNICKPVVYSNYNFNNIFTFLLYNIIY